jgi:hypothetical protein
MDQANRIQDVQSLEQQDESGAPNVPELVRPTQKSMRYAEKLLVTLNAVETRRNKGVKIK